MQPESIDCSTIDPRIALELRLPPKVSYAFVFIRYGLSGGAALTDFLSHVGVVENTHNDIFRKIKGVYSYLCINHLWRREEKNLQKVLYVLNNSDQILINVRDPISRIKHAINHGWFKTGDDDSAVEFSIKDDPYQVVDNIRFYTEAGKMVANHPFIYNSFLEYVMKLCSFAYYSNIAVLPKNANITYLDMQEIMPEKAFDTMTQLAKQFGFSLPMESDRELYSEIKMGVFRYILPLVCNIISQTEVKMTLHITMRYYCRDTSLLIVDNTIFDTPHPLLDQVAFSMSEDDLKALQDDKETLDKVKAYMVRFLDELKKRTDYIQRNKKHENDVLEIFRGDRDLRKQFKAMLDRELIHIKAHRPDIVASWKYYQEFERMCVEEGDM